MYPSLKSTKLQNMVAILKASKMFIDINTYRYQYQYASNPNVQPNLYLYIL